MPPLGFEPGNQASDLPHTLNLDHCVLFVFFFIYLFQSFLSIVYFCILYPRVSYFSTSHTFVPPEGFEPAIPASNRPQTLALDRSTTGISNDCVLEGKNGWKERSGNRKWCVYVLIDAGMCFRKSVLPVKIVVDVYRYVHELRYLSRHIDHVTVPLSNR
jgi:hypothetical protein